MDELIDIYDEKQNFIKKEMKSVAHKNGDWHKSIHAYLVNPRGQMIVQKRNSNKDLYPNFWDVSFAGHVGAGEDTKSSAKRECEEELGIKLNDDEIQFLFTIPEQLVWGDVKSYEFVDVFIVKKEFDKIIKQDEEVADVEVITIQKFIDLVENKDKNLFPHYAEYEKLIPILKKYIK